MRDRIVEFDWFFTLNELRGLRRGVYEWGKKVPGRYRCFDARVLAAINDALEDQASPFVLNEPKNYGSWAACEVQCTRLGDLYRLHGHAPFDLVFGYGAAGVHDATHGVVHLGAAVRARLAETVNALGWDLGKLHEERLRPVRNALYGLAPGYGPPNPLPTEGPITDLAVRFQGPFSAFDGEEGCRCLFNDDDVAKKSGIYLWTVSVDGEERPWYVGQTRVGFRARMGQHLAAMLSGQYTTYDAGALATGELRLAQGAIAPNWPASLPSFLRHYEQLVPHIFGSLRLLRFHLAPLVGDAHLHNRVEG